MALRQRKHRGSKQSVKQAYHFKACGLDDVYLLNGFTFEDTADGPAITILNPDGLHRAIGQNIIFGAHLLTPKEVRFLRTHMNWKQDQLAQLLGCSVVMISRYENGATPIPHASDRLLRVNYAWHLWPASGRHQVIDHIFALRETRQHQTDEPTVVYFSRKRSGDWVERNAA